jgi:hypothetical protein
MVLICVIGISLIVYSRNERLHPVVKATEGPTATDVWQAAIGFDICGKLQTDLPASTNISTVGLRTFGNGLIDIDPGASTTPADFEGKKATLGLFVKDYQGLTLTSTSLKLPGTGQKLWKNGDKCGKTASSVQTEVWSSPGGKGKLVTGDPTKLHLTNGQMITVAFVPKGTTIPQPPSKSALLTALGSTTTASSSTTSTTTAVTTTTKASSTATTAAKSKSTTTT